MTDTLRADVLAFLRKEHVADISAISELETMTGRGLFTEEDEAMKTFRAREALIAKLEAFPVEAISPLQAAARTALARLEEKPPAVEAAIGWLRSAVKAPDV